MAIAIAVLTALLAACCFGVAAVVQQATASSMPEAQSLRPRLLWALAHRPLWLVGISMSVASYFIQGVALAFGSLVLVMPLASTDLLFALPLVAWRRGQRFTPIEAAGAACTAGGVAAFLTVLPRTADVAAPGLWGWLPLLLVTASLVTVLVSAGLRNSGRRRAGMYAAAAGLLFALLDALTKAAADLLRHDGWAALRHWEPYALLVIGGTGLLLAQSSYQAGSLAISLPLIDTLEPIGAVLMGTLIFQERLASSGALVVQILGGVLAVTGIIILDRSPLVRA
ncbi:DMT family transporter [Actinoallomurus rhizosphaericola]|uniref:DMT family transporter n=1 Tax=Actinoallomurus rhizosphaericola TaxID=2952536 RepID=UPI0020933E22|nr:DMT family transporter [Actinoallomurus rhizosphaericola]MCO5996880.1 DMT family transporter [Actinoallomurus rhizosphaericola]